MKEAPPSQFSKISSSPHRLLTPRFPPRRKILLELRASVLRLQVNDVVLLPLRPARGIDIAGIRHGLPQADVVVGSERRMPERPFVRTTKIVTDMLDLTATGARLMAFICTTLLATDPHAWFISTGSCCASCPPIWPFEGVGPGAAPPPFGFGAAACACALANLNAAAIMAFEISERSRSL